MQRQSLPVVAGGAALLFLPLLTEAVQADDHASGGMGASARPILLKKWTTIKPCPSRFSPTAVAPALAASSRRWTRCRKACSCLSALPVIAFTGGSRTRSSNP